MADLKLTISGDNQAGTALADAAQGVEDVGEAHSKLAMAIETAHVAWEAMEGVVEKAIEFGKESVKLLQEQEKADRQLALAVGESSEALKKQAEVLEKSLGIDAVKTEKIQALLFRFGEAPDKIDETVRALYDYAAVTGVDALQAAEHLTSSVETGRAAFKELGITYKETGDKSTDLVAATQALAAKVGGAAQSDANSAAGQAKIAAAEFENFQKALAAVFTDASQGSSVLQNLTDVIRGMTLALAPDDPREKKLEELMQKELEAADAVKAAREQVANAAMMPANLVKTSVLDTAKGLDDALKRLHEIQAERKRLLHGEELGSDNPNGGLTGKATKEAAAKAVKEVKQVERDTTAEEDAKDAVLALHNAEVKRQQRVKDAEEAGKEVAKRIEEQAKLEEQAAEKHKREQEDLARHDQQVWEQAAESISNVLAEKIGAGIEAALSGEKTDPNAISSTIAALLGIAGSVAGTFLGGPLGTAIGGGLGKLAGSAVTGLGKRYSFHDGGWVDGWPRHHDGTWSQDEHPAILQRGERVLSRGEVAQAGGAAAVDAMAQGRGGRAVTVNVTTMDASSTKEFFEKQGGRAFMNAVRTGRGPLPAMFGV